MRRHLPILDESLTKEQLRDRARGRRKRSVQAKTVAIRDIPKRALARGRLLYPIDPGERRPSVRADCVDGPRPCVHVACKWNLYLDVNPRGNIMLNFPDLEPHEMTESCALDLADRGPSTLERVGDAMNFTRERCRQIANRALMKLLGPGTVEIVGGLR